MRRYKKKLEEQLTTNKKTLTINIQPEKSFRQTSTFQYKLESVQVRSQFSPRYALFLQPWLNSDITDRSI